MSTIRHFRNEYEAHVYDERCHAGVCTAMLRYVIDPQKCKGCTVCAKNCPVDAITGDVKRPHGIDASKCIKCGVCMQKCKFDAISKEK